MTVQIAQKLSMKGDADGIVVTAFKVSPDSILCCHEEEASSFSSSLPPAWSITHCVTGLSVNPSRVPDKHHALLLICMYEDLPGWDNPDETLSAAVDETYEQFWERIRPEMTVTVYGEMCPRPANAAPPGPMTVEQCKARGECGCDR